MAESNYKILVVASKKSDNNSLYKYLTVKDSETGITKPVEFTTYKELDTYVENMLNDGGYAKSDFIIVKDIDYKVNANIDVFTLEAESYKGEYDGEEHVCPAFVNKIDTNILYSINGSDEWTTKAPSIINAGTINVVAKASNYEYGDAETKYSMVVLPKNVDVKLINVPENHFVYGDDIPKDIAVEFNGLLDSEFDKSWRIKVIPNNDVSNTFYYDKDTVSVKFANAGTYVLIAEYDNDTNYNFADCENGTIIIDKKNITVKVNPDQELNDDDVYEVTITFNGTEVSESLANSIKNDIYFSVEGQNIVPKLKSSSTLEENYNIELVSEKKKAIVIPDDTE